MNTDKIVYWKDGPWWLGYLQDYPDYRTQGKTLRELQENLKELHKDITTGSHIELSDAIKIELDRRIAAADANPERGSTWDGLKSRLGTS